MKTKSFREACDILPFNAGTLLLFAKILIQTEDFAVMNRSEGMLYWQISTTPYTLERSVCGFIKWTDVQY